MKKSYPVEVDCAACALKMEDAAKKTSGVKDASVNFMTLKMKVEFEDGADPDAVMKEVRSNCRRVDSDFDIQL
ncbi:cation transporter [Chordicoccus furentiruminis]|uniref:cation transporter n=1 Tax=Chordicoccus furentiruminis TaxID=2709410 RepID=UPI0023A8FC2B|nr:cation transporter [Chordicoccus furentiruminis]